MEPSPHITIVLNPVAVALDEFDQPLGSSNWQLYIHSPLITNSKWFSTPTTIKKNLTPNHQTVLKLLPSDLVTPVAKYKITYKPTNPQQLARTEEWVVPSTYPQVITTLEVNPNQLNYQLPANFAKAISITSLAPTPLPDYIINNQTLTFQQPPSSQHLNLSYYSYLRHLDVVYPKPHLQHPEFLVPSFYEN